MSLVCASVISSFMPSLFLLFLSPLFFSFLLFLSPVLNLQDFLSWFSLFDHFSSVSSAPFCLFLHSTFNSVSLFNLSFCTDLFRSPSLIFCTTFASSFCRFALPPFPLPLIHQFNTPTPPGVSRTEIDEKRFCLFFLSVYLPFRIVQVSHELNIDTLPKSFI